MAGLSTHLRDLGQLTAARVFARGGGLVITALIARYLGADDFGRFSLCISFSALFAVLARLGTRQILLREVIRRPSEQGTLIGSALTATLLQSGAAISVTVLIALAMGYRGLTLIGIAIMTCAIVFNSLESLIFAVMESRAAFGGIAITTIVRQVIWIALAVVIILLSGTWLGLLAGLATTGALIALLLWVWLLREWGRTALRPSTAAMRELIVSGLPLAGAALLVDIYLRIDILMIDQMLTKTAVGQYAASFRIVNAFIFLSATFYTVLYPLYTRLHIEDPHRLSNIYVRSTRLVYLVMAYMALAVSLFSREIIGLIYGPAFASAATALRVAVWAVAIQAVAVLAGRLLVTTRRESMVLKGSAISVLLNVTLNFLMIPRFGIAGAAAASAVTMLGVAAYNVYALRSLIENLGSLAWGVAKISLLAGCALLTARLLFPIYPRSIVSALILIIYPLLALGLGLVDLSVVAVMRRRTGI